MGKNATPHEIIARAEERRREEARKIIDRKRREYMRDELGLSNEKIEKIISNEPASWVIDAVAEARANADELVEQRAGRLSELEAARHAYASEFPLNADGEPDVGNIHQNIRALLQRLAELEAELASAREAERVQRERAERLAEALRGWWKAHRPVGWAEDQHRSCPHVNLATDEEKALATALLRYQEE